MNRRDRSPLLQAMIEKNMRPIDMHDIEDAYETFIKVCEDDLHGPTFDNADDLIADLHSD